MIISRTPYRLSFFGGGTDYPEWYLQHGGSVLATTIDKFCYITCRYLPPFFEHRYRVVWSRVENCREIGEIEHPVVRDLLGFLGLDRGVEIHHVGDLPARSGMGTSSSFTVGLLHALHALTGRMVAKRQLMEEAIHVEQERLGECVGSQDQVSAAFGGFNRIDFMPNGQIAVQPMLLPVERVAELDSHLMLFYTGIVRNASEIAQTWVTDVAAKKRKLRILRDLVDESIELLTRNDDLSAFGELLDEAWHVKQSLGARISNSDIDGYYARAKAAGAIGGKVAGAGGGGFLLLFVPPARQREVTEALRELVHVPFSFESGGSQIVFFDREEDFSFAEVERANRPIRPFRELSELCDSHRSDPILEPAASMPRGAFPNPNMAKTERANT